MAQERILAIEDDMDVAELLVMFFTSQGYEIFHADTGTEGIALARAKLPNLILLDIMLPDMEGFQVCRKLRGTALTKYIPTVFLTQRNAHADKVSGLELGADDYITKPFDVEELRVRVQRSIQRATSDHLHEAITGLPTGPLVEAEFDAFLQGNAPWTRVDIRVQGFDAFRDAYGFLTANDALSLATKILTANVVRYGTHNDFIGVIGNGHFTVFTFMEDVRPFLESLGTEFAERASALYRYTDVQRGYLVMEDAQNAPLMHFALQTQSFGRR